MFGTVDITWAAFAPALVLLVTASATLLFALWQDDTRPSAIFSVIGVVLAAAFNLHLFATGAVTGVFEASFGLRFLADNPALALNFVILLGTLLAVLISYDYVERTGLAQPEYYPLLLFSATGAMVMVAAGDLITLVLGLEIMSLAVYALSAWRQNSRASEEAGMKYFLLGAFASAFLIYGVAMTYGAAGAFTFPEIAAALASPEFDRGFYALLGGVFLLAGLGFKVAFAPFHQWAPDVYTGAPTAVTAFMSVVVKAAAFGALLRVAAALLPVMPLLITQLLVALIVLTLLVGNFSALLQGGVKRMLAYSAVAHAGYLGLAVLAAPTTGVQAAVWYLTAYTLMNAGAFAVLSLLADAHDRGDALERLSGLGRTRPGLAAALTIFLLSLAGIPLFAGFVGKVLVFQAAIPAGYLELAVFAILTSVVAVVYYVRPITYMYFRESEYPPNRGRSRATDWAVLIAAVGTVALGLFPGWWYGLLQGSGLILAGF
jgi:NADH-quinone oxidoreductase subunit N